MKTRYRRAIAAWAALSVVAGCTLTRDLDYLTTPSAVAQEGGPPPIPEAGPVPVDVDSGPPPCVPGTIIRPVRTIAFEAPAVPGETPQGLACNLENALEDDGKVAGLDRKENGDVGRTYVQGQQVAGCVGVEFAPDVVVKEAIVKLGPVHDACGVTPCVEGTTDGCGTNTGFQALFFAGTAATADDLRFIAQVKYGQVVEVVRRLLEPAATNVHVIVVCHHGNVSITRDDVGVDAIWTECK